MANDNGNSRIARKIRELEEIKKKYKSREDLAFGETRNYYTGKVDGLTVAILSIKELLR